MRWKSRSDTDGAINAGAFGVPTMLADGEFFWGYDHSGHLDRFLSGHDPLDETTLARWTDLPASASRL